MLKLVVLYTDLQRLISKLDKRVEKQAATKPSQFQGFRRVEREPSNSLPPDNTPAWAVESSYCCDSSQTQSATTPIRAQDVLRTRHTLSTTFSPAAIIGSQNLSDSSSDDYDDFMIKLN